MGIDQAVQQSQIRPVLLNGGYLSYKELPISECLKPCVIRILDGVVRTQKMLTLDHDEFSLVICQELGLTLLKKLDFHFEGHSGCTSHRL